MKTVGLGSEEGEGKEDMAVLIGRSYENPEGETTCETSMILVNATDISVIALRKFGRSQRHRIQSGRSSSLQLRF